MLAQPTVISPDAAAQEGLRREEARNRLQQQQLQPRADVLRPTTRQLRDQNFPLEEPCFTVREVRIEGDAAPRFGWLSANAQAFVGRCAGVQGLSRIAGSLDEELLSRGFATTRVSLPAQNLQSGVLRVRLHAGRVAAIRMVDATQPTPAGIASGARPPIEHWQADTRWGTWRNAFSLAPGDILNIRDLEQGVEQMNRLPSQSVNTQLEPGEAPDTSVVIIQRRAGLTERVRGTATVDNSGGSALGRAQFSGNLAVDNPLGLNDVLSANLASNLQDASASHRSQSLGLNYSVPWGYNTFSLSASHSRFAQSVQGTTVRFLSSGQSDSAEARLARTVLRTSSAKLGFYGGVSLRRAQSYIDDVELIVQRRRTTNAEVGFNYRQLFERSSLDLDLGYRRGVPWRNAQEDLPDAQAGGATLRPRIATFSASYGSAFSLAGRQMQYNGTLRGQYTRDTTLSIDQLSIGGRHTVRGFTGDVVLLAEKGLVWRNDLSWPVSMGQGIDAQAVLGLDWGRVWGPSDVLLAGHQLAGAALGLRGRARGLYFDVSLATPLHRPDNFRAKRLVAYASVTYPF
ncbi:MAG: ShlB/FhaC/HecB family hemolysin secretion/activation protein [Ramlibacter sp.]